MDDRAPDRGTIDELSALADELLDQATEVRRQWSALGETLGIETPVDGADRAPAPAAQRQDAEWNDTDPMRLVALDMMLSGRSRDEVSEYIRATFGADVRPDVLDEIFNERTS